MRRLLLALVTIATFSCISLDGKVDPAKRKDYEVTKASDSLLSKSKKYEKKRYKAQKIKLKRNRRIVVTETRKKSDAALLGKRARIDSTNTKAKVIEKKTFVDSGETRVASEMNATISEVDPLDLDVLEAPEARNAADEKKASQEAINRFANVKQTGAEGVESRKAGSEE